MNFLFKTKVYLQELFYFLSLSCVLFFGMELLQAGIVLAYFNLNRLLIFWLIIGIMIVIIPENKKNGF